MLEAMTNEEVFREASSCQSLPSFAAFLGVSYLTAWRLAEEGTLKTIFVGARRIVPPDEQARVLREGLPTPRARQAAKKAKVEVNARVQRATKVRKTRREPNTAR